MANGVSSKHGYLLINSAKISIKKNEREIIHIHHSHPHSPQIEKIAKTIEENVRFQRIHLRVLNIANEVITITVSEQKNKKRNGCPQVENHASRFQCQG